jgi:hypothetical protein
MWFWVLGSVSILDSGLWNLLCIILGYGICSASALWIIGILLVRLLLGPSPALRVRLLLHFCIFYMSAGCALFNLRVHIITC